MAHIDLREFRRIRNIKQRELAEKLGITQSFLSNIERGRSPLPADKMQRIIEIYEIESLDEFVVYDERDKVNGGNVNSNNVNSTINDMESMSEVMREIIASSKSGDKEVSGAVSELVKRYGEMMDSVMRRNGQLLEKSDELRSELDAARKENDELRKQILDLRTILIKNHIEYD